VIIYVITKAILELIQINTILEQHSYIVNHGIQPQNVGSYTYFVLVNEDRIFKHNVYLGWVQIFYFYKQFYKIDVSVAMVSY